MTRDAGGNREPGHRWDPGNGAQVRTGNRDAGGTQNFSDLKFELLKNEKCFSKLF